MKAKLYLNNVLFCIVDLSENQSIVCWNHPTLIEKVLEFRHCGLGNYHCHITKEEEGIIRDEG